MPKNGLTAFKLCTEYPLSTGDKRLGIAGDTAIKNGIRGGNMEFLKEILGDALYGQVSEKLKGNDNVKLANLAGGEYVSKAKYEALDEKFKELEKQLTERDTQLETLKKSAKDNEELTKQIKELQSANETAQKDWQAKLAAQERDFAMRETLKNDYKARDVISVIPHLKQDSILFADGKFTGLDEQVKALQKDKSFLFETDSNVPSGTGGAPGAVDTPPASEFSFGFSPVLSVPNK